MSTEFVFDNKARYLEGSLISASNVSYILSSTFAKRGDRMPVVTTLKGPYGHQASISWLGPALEVDGSKLRVDDIRFKEKGPGSLFARRWVYQKNQWRVKFEYDAKTWNVFHVLGDTAEQTPSAVFKLYRSKLIGPSVPASKSPNIPPFPSLRGCPKTLREQSHFPDSFACTSYAVVPMRART
ncbi:hypothetical protein LshimejAT787_0411330 [Lyophyllum shimeji]|uniref:Uncharacterized protein n=1 Tax=Lyophyllum shimeji TaxID=47721 RepID=A0A9P3UM78_LYOSH|nr:hypothetical protein LshimejAT787_0411330 [Lyophyllum shimeji]